MRAEKTLKFIFRKEDNMFKKHISAVLFLAMLMSVVTSCGGEGSSDVTTRSDTTPESTTEATWIPDVNYDGYKFRVLNFETYFSSYIRVDVQEQSGEMLDDAVYNRNRKIEQAMNFTLEEVKMPYAQWNTDQIALMDRVTNSVMAGDDEFDAAYVQPYFKPAILTEGSLVDLNSIPELKLDEIWWDRSLNSSFDINGKLYAATGALQFMPLDSVWVLLFNETKLDSLQLEYPYQLVRDGKWTLDKFYEYAQKCTQLNGDESFTWNESGNAVYGIAGHTSVPGAMIYSCDYRFVEPDKGGYKVQLTSEKLVDALGKITKLFDSENGIIRVNNGSGEKSDGYIGMFRNGRAAFVTVGLAAVSEYRNMNDSYGLVPFPKYDEAQENYITQTGVSSQMLGIPVTVKDLSRAGNILEALTHESYDSVMPVYYGVRVEQKGLRNEDSIEMLQLVRNNYGLESAQVLGVTSGYISALTSMVQNQESNAASLAASNEATVKTKLDELLKSFG